MKLDDKKLDEIVQKIVEFVHPIRIVLFGSAARGTMKRNSDIDLLIIMPDGTHRRKTAQLLYRNLLGVGFAKDIIVVTQTDIIKYHNSIGLVIKSALAEGREVYHEA